MQLTDTERMLLAGFSAREREIQTSLLEPLQRDYESFGRMIEERLGLEQGALGTTHRVDAETLMVEPMPEVTVQDLGEQMANQTIVSEA